MRSPAPRRKRITTAVSLPVGRGEARRRTRVRPQDLAKALELLAYLRTIQTATGQEDGS